MSGGAFDYKQYWICEIADNIEEYVYGKELDDEEIQDYLCTTWEEDRKEYIKEHHHTMPNPYNFSEDTIKEFKKAIDALRIAEVYAQRVDWLLEGDDGEDDFHQRLKEDLAKLKKSY